MTTNKRNREAQKRRRLSALDRLRKSFALSVERAKATVDESHKFWVNAASREGQEIATLEERLR